MVKIISLLLVFLSAAILCGREYYISFAEGKWNPEDFQIVKAPGNTTVGAMLQNKDHIANQVPAGMSADKLLSSKETYCALVCKKKFHGDITVSSKMSFDHRMAPLIVIAPELGKSADGKYPEFREHFEIVLYDQGINLWHHQYENGRQVWYKLAYLAGKFSPEKIYDLAVSLRHTAKGIQMVIRCDGKEFGCTLPAGFKTDGYFAGITGCEGVNRFYDFKVTQTVPGK
ncbi:MAG: hypothetical protein E7051_07585 [Lentisphaerae bacterium]|nr:hypothetical protein [Lentisphaerota bacterium]